MTSRVALLMTLAAAAAMMAGLFVAGIERGPGTLTDTPVYRLYGERIASGDLPYRDFVVEYPPGALVPFVVAALVSSTPDGYDSAFQSMMIYALALASVLIVLSLEALRARPWHVGLSVGAFLAGIALLGVAIATKIYPAVLLPLLVTRIWRSEGRAAALRGLGLTVGTTLAIYLPFAILAPEGVARSIWRQVGRPLQIESLGSGVLLAFHHAAGMPLGWASGSGSQNLTGTVASVASAVTTLAGLAALLLVWVRFARGDTESAGRFARYGAAAIVAFVAFGKVASPQFLIWLLAVVVLVPGLRGMIATLLLLAACAVTRMWFPRTYWDLVKQFDPTASWLVLARDILLVAVFVVLIARIRARESEPV